MCDAVLDREPRFDLLVESLFTFDDAVSLDGPLGDGRVAPVQWNLDQPGGMCVHATRAVRLFDPNAEVVPFSLVGERDIAVAFAMLRDRGVMCADGLVPVAGKLTNRNRIYEDPDGHRMIIQETREIVPDQDLRFPYWRRLHIFLGQSRAFLTRHTPPEHCERLLRFARTRNVYCGVCPAPVHHAVVSNLHPHLLVCNDKEIADIVGRRFSRPTQLFDVFVDGVCADQVIMTTGPGPVYVADRHSRSRFTVDSLPLPSLWRGQRLRSVGCGDVFAGTICFLMGQATVRNAELLREAVHFAQHVVGVHMTDNYEAHQHLRAEYARICSELGRYLGDCLANEHDVAQELAD